MAAEDMLLTLSLVWSTGVIISDRSSRIKTCLGNGAGIVMQCALDKTILDINA
jgi:hypothetical protein